MIHEKDIQNSKPKQDCIYCELRHFHDLLGNVMPEYYAVCSNKVKSHGQVTADIVADFEPFSWAVTCKNCKLYKPKNQLQLELL